MPTPDSPARRLFARCSGAFLFGVLALMVVQGVLLAVEGRLDRLMVPSPPQPGDLVYPHFWFWMYALFTFPQNGWAALRQPWPVSALKVPGSLALATFILTCGKLIQLVHDRFDLFSGQLTGTFFLFAAQLAAYFLPPTVVYYTTRYWLLGPAPPKPKTFRPYAAASAYKSSDGKPLWGYRLIFQFLGWALILGTIAAVFENALVALWLPILSIACFLLWRALHACQFSPKVWQAGLALLFALAATSAFAGTAAVPSIVFFGFCIANWTAATARDLFFRKPQAVVLDGSSTQI